MKNILRLLIICTAFLACSLYGEAIPIAREYKKHQPSIKVHRPEYNYPANPHIPHEVWNLVKPHLLPSNHPLKAQLDSIFKQQRVTKNLQTLCNAGFSRCYIRGYSQLVVTKHPMLRGYWLKLFIDEQDITDYPILIHRIQGANDIRNSIDRHGYHHFFSVPVKWLYPLPAEPSPPADHHRKNFILIAEDMKIYKKKENAQKWAAKITPPRALAIYTILQELGLNDCIHPFNLPFCEDGRQAFIDTEHHHNWPVYFNLMTKHLPIAIANYWHKIIETDGHPD
jgi:hypothetical protein